LTQQEMLAKLTNISSLNDLQEYIQRVINARGFGDETAADALLMLVEEVGELAKAIRKSRGMFVDPDRLENYGDIEGELADCFVLLLSIANAEKINLFDALIAKETENCNRHWEKSS